MNLITKIFVAFIIVLILTLAYKACYPEINLDIISQIESSNNPQAVSYAGAKYGRGLYQISEIALKDYNIENHTAIAPEELFNPEINKQIAQWLFEVRIPQILNNWDIPITNETLLWAYNAGVGRVKQGVMPKETKNYIRKYKERSKK